MRRLKKQELYPYRRKNLKPAKEKRIKKVSQKSLKDFNPLFVYFTLPFSPYSAGAVVSFLHTVVWKFFLPQYARKIGLKKTPVKNVDHELDTKVPFSPEHVYVYFGFVNFWIRPLVMMQKRYGALNGSKLCAEFINYITKAYSEAYRVYSKTMTTTVRPKCRDNATISTIQRGDPHYMCVPSLHIAVCCLGFSFYRMLFERECFTEQEKTLWLKELHDEAVQIADSVLYVKQHSVNCIPAAIYMMTKITPELFTIQDGVDFINCMFSDKDDIKSDDKKLIRAHIQFMFERLVLDGADEDDWTVPVNRWISGYEPYVYRS